MYDRDILGLQVGASLTAPDIYLIQLLHKFNLLEWVRYVFFFSRLSYQSMTSLSNVMR